MIIVQDDVVIIDKETNEALIEEKKIEDLNGHSFDDIESALHNARATKGKPTAIIATTVKGKGVSFMENQVNWHGAAPNAEQYEIAMNELKEVLIGLEG